MARSRWSHNTSAAHPVDCGKASWRFLTLTALASAVEDRPRQPTMRRPILPLSPPLALALALALGARWQAAALVYQQLTVRLLVRVLVLVLVRQ